MHVNKNHAAWARIALPALLCMSTANVAFAACDVPPGDSTFCWTSKCGPCALAEGDCDPNANQCDPGLTCVEEGSVDRCRANAGSCTPNAMDFCASSQCGPCAEGFGDCDPGQCGAGLECVEEGAVDRCRTASSTCTANPGASDYCSSSKCGPCGLGEGDCDSGQCESGLECVEEGSVDRCRTASVGTGSSNLQVKVNGIWEGVCCVNGDLELSNMNCLWTESNRRLTDQTAGLELDCHEGSPQDCDCDSTGENMHGDGGGSLWSIKSPNTGPMYPDYTIDTCVVVDSSGNLRTDWTGPNCPDFKLE